MFDAPTGGNASRDCQRSAMNRSAENDKVLTPWANGEHAKSREAAIERFAPTLAVYKAIEGAYPGG